MTRTVLPAKLDELTQLNRINYLPPLQNVTIDARTTSYMTGTHLEIDEVKVGHSSTSNGNMVRRDANVFWFVNSTTICHPRTRRSKGLKAKKSFHNLCNNRVISFKVKYHKNFTIRIFLTICLSSSLPRTLTHDSLLHLSTQFIIPIDFNKHRK